MDDVSARETLNEAIALLTCATEGGQAWRVRTAGADTYVECGARDRWVAFYCGDDPMAASVGRWIALMDPIVGRLLIDVLEGCLSDAENGGDVHPEWAALAEVLVTKGAGLYSS